MAGDDGPIPNQEDQDNQADPDGPQAQLLFFPGVPPAGVGVL
jgi:hypothetical protein